MARRMRQEAKCPTGCKSFCDLPVGWYYQGCGPRVRERLARGEPATAYEKVSGPRTTRTGQYYEGGAVEFLLKSRGFGPKAAPYFPIRGCPCVKPLGPHHSDIGRRRAMEIAERYQAWKAGRGRARRVA